MTLTASRRSKRLVEMRTPELLEKLFDIERSIGIEDNATIRKKLMEVEEDVLLLQREKAGILYPTSKSSDCGAQSKSEATAFLLQLLWLLRVAVHVRHMQGPESRKKKGARRLPALLIASLPKLYTPDPCNPFNPSPSVENSYSSKLKPWATGSQRSNAALNKRMECAKERRMKRIQGLAYAIEQMKAELERHHGI
jgi:hypothetical protein